MHTHNLLCTYVHTFVYTGIMLCIYGIMLLYHFLVYRSVAQLNARLTQEATTYTKEIELLHGKHADELKKIRTVNSQRVDNLQKQM